MILKKQVLIALSGTVMLLVMLAGGCKRNKDARTDLPCVDGYEEIAEIYPDVTADVRIVPLEETDSSMLVSIKQVERLDSAYLVFDNFNEALYRFSLDGQLLNRIGRKGRSGAEYVRLDAFIAGPDGRVLLVDGATDRILVYGPDGRYVSTYSFPKRALGFMNQGVFLGNDSLFVSNRIFGEDNGIFRKICLSACTVLTVGTVPMKSPGIVESLLIHPICIGEQPVFVRPFNDVVYAFDRNGAAEPLFRVGHSKPLADKEFFASHPVFSSAQTSMDLSSAGLFRGFTSLFASDRHYLLGGSNTDYFLVGRQSNVGIRLVSGGAKLESMPLLNIAGAFSDGFIGVWEPSGFSSKMLLETLDKSESVKAADFAGKLRAIPGNANPCLLVYGIK